MTGVGPAAVRQPRVRDREAGTDDLARIRFTPASRQSMKVSDPWNGSIQCAGALRQAMIGVTISGAAYAVIASTLPESSPSRAGNSSGEYRVWLPRAVVNQLRALREAGETFSDVIPRLEQR